MKKLFVTLFLCIVFKNFAMTPESGNMKNLYEVLGLSFPSSKEQVDAAYKKKLEQYRSDIHHPEHGESERLKELKGAYEILGDDYKRGAFDISFNLYKLYQTESPNILQEIKNSQFIDYYACLGVPSNATKEMITQKFRTLCVEHHPDKNTGNAYANSIFKDIMRAYTHLSDLYLRGRYDFFYNLRHTLFRSQPYSFVPNSAPRPQPKPKQPSVSPQEKLRREKEAFKNNWKEVMGVDILGGVNYGQRAHKLSNWVRENFGGWGLFVEQINEYGQAWSFLLHAMNKEGFNGIVDAVVDAGIDSKAIEEHIINCRSEKNLASYLKKVHPDFSCSGYNNTLLHYAQTPKIVDLLLSRKANVNRTNNLGWTPLFSTVYHQYYSLKDNPSYVSENSNKWLEYNNDYAVIIAKKLLNAGANINHQAKDGSTLMHGLLYASCLHKSPEKLAQLFIDRGLRLTALKNNDGKSSVDFANMVLKKNAWHTKENCKFTGRCLGKQHQIKFAEWLINKSKNPMRRFKNWKRYK